MKAQVGVGRLTHAGDRVRIEMSKESPVNLGAMFLDGSVFIHGTCYIELLGLGLVDGAPCAILRIEETGGGYRMRIRPMPGMTVKSVGATRLTADVHINLETGWVERTDATVVDVTKTTLFGVPVDVSTMITDIRIRAAADAPASSL
jgi:hypothetical protein